MKPPRNSAVDRLVRAAVEPRAGVKPAVEQADAERVESAVDLRSGLQVTDVSDTMSNDLIDQLFRPAPRSR